MGLFKQIVERAWRVTTFEHRLELGVRIGLGAGFAKRGLVIHPGVNDDFMFA